MSSLKQQQSKSSNNKNKNKHQQTKSIAKSSYIKK